MVALLVALSDWSVSMTSEEERWAEALAIHPMHGDGAPAHVAARISALALTGDVDGIDRFKQIAIRLNRLMAGSLQ